MPGKERDSGIEYILVINKKFLEKFSTQDGTLTNDIFHSETGLFKLLYGSNELNSTYPEKTQPNGDHKQDKELAGLEHNIKPTRGETEFYGPTWSKAIRSQRFLEVLRDKNAQASKRNTDHDLDNSYSSCDHSNKFELIASMSVEYWKQSTRSEPSLRPVPITFGVSLIREAVKSPEPPDIITL
uniref:Uncharacterized protein n=1 Tax=Glossina pallidipes TaxID=7398 RepID=A0A1A9ZW63_GLOPL